MSKQTATLHFIYRKLAGRHFYYPQPDCPMANALKDLVRRDKSLTKEDIVKLATILDGFGIETEIELEAANDLKRKTQISEDAYEF